MAFPTGIVSYNPVLLGNSIFLVYQETARMRILCVQQLNTTQSVPMRGYFRISSILVKFKAQCLKRDKNILGWESECQAKRDHLPQTLHCENRAAERYKDTGPGQGDTQTQQGCVYTNIHGLSPT